MLETEVSHVKEIDGMLLAQMFLHFEEALRYARKNYLKERALSIFPPERTEDGICGQCVYQKAKNSPQELISIVVNMCNCYNRIVREGANMTEGVKVQALMNLCIGVALHELRHSWQNTIGAFKNDNEAREKDAKAFELHYRSTVYTELAKMIRVVR